MAVPPPPPADDKRALRAILRTRRAAQVAGLRATGDGHAAALRVAAAHVLTHVPPGAIVALYRAMGDEIDPAPLAMALAAAGHDLALPHVTSRDAPLRFFAWRPGAPLYAGIFGLEQPHADGAMPAPDVIVTPLVGFDRTGGRIGQGAGHYDRAFAAFPAARRIGYAWSAQEVDVVPRDPWDVALDAIATEREWIAVTKARA